MNETLALTNQYGIAGLYGSKIATEAATQARSLGLTSTPKDRQFVRDVFEGDFRPMSGSGAGDIARDVFLGLNRWTAAASALFDAQPVADDALMLQKARSTITGLQRRIDANDGGVLRALNVSCGGRRGQDYVQFEQKALWSLHQVLATKVRTSNQQYSAESLYRAFVSMPQAERSQLGALLNANLNRP